MRFIGAPPAWVNILGAANIAGDEVGGVVDIVDIVDIVDA